MDKYNYLKKFINNSNTPAPRNSFSKIDFQDIKNAEDRLGFEFPKSLKEFLLEIGCGVLSKSINGNSFLCYSNCLLPPKQIADIMILKEESDYILPEAVEYIEEGYIKNDDIIFFEVGDLSSFLVMKPSSNKPDAIYTMLGNLIEEHFERFIWRLYHESPDYYLRVNNFL
ncbi:MAG: SMI1/KNR4 family protein [Rickettsia endosymbiont of Platyusa sonomae]|nr:SMI1/KNR4 family protein [Rickettsia endosymbiont of Platyusa sonomae]